MYVFYQLLNDWKQTVMKTKIMNTGWSFSHNVFYKTLLWNIVYIKVKLKFYIAHKAAVINKLNRALSM